MAEIPTECRILVGNPLGRYPLEERGDGRLTLRLILRKYRE
jgi:hypothetical protein